MMEKENALNIIEDDIDRRNRNWDKVDAHLAEYATLLEGGEPLEMAIVAPGWTGQMFVSKNVLGHVAVWGRIQPPTTVGTNIIPIGNLPSGYRPLTDVSGLLFNTNNGRTYRSIFAVPAGLVRFVNQDALDTSRDYTFYFFYNTR